LGVGDDDQEEIERPGPMRTAGQPVIPYQTLIDPTELGKKECHLLSSRAFYPTAIRSSAAIARPAAKIYRSFRAWWCLNFAIPSLAPNRSRNNKTCKPLCASKKKSVTYFAIKGGHENSAMVGAGLEFFASLAGGGSASEQINGVLDQVKGYQNMGLTDYDAGKLAAAQQLPVLSSIVRTEEMYQGKSAGALDFNRELTGVDYASKTLLTVGDVAGNAAYGASQGLVPQRLGGKPGASVAAATAGQNSLDQYIKEPLDKFAYDQHPDARPLNAHTPDGLYNYVRDAEGKVMLGPAAPHTHPKILGGGKPATGSGSLRIENGVVTKLDNGSGTFRHGPETIPSVIESIKKQGMKVDPRAPDPVVFPAPAAPSAEKKTGG